MNAVIKAIQAALNLAAGYVPAKFRGILALVASLIGTLNLPPADPRAAEIAKLVAELLDDLKAALELTDSNAQEAARLLAENRFLHAWAKLTPGGLS